MAKKKTKKEPIQTAPPEPVGVFWYIMAAVAALAALTMIVAACLPGWRITNKAIYRYKNPTSDQYTQSIIEASQWGLFVYHFNGGAASNPVQSIASTLCKSADFEESTNSVINGLYSLGCATTCQSHLRTRCTAYQRLADAGYVTLAGCLLAGLLILVGAIWIALVGKSYTALLVLWGIAVISNCGTSLYWLYETTTQFTKLGVESQYPSSHVGYAWWMNLGAGATYILCWIITALGACIGDKIKWKRRQEEIVDFMLRSPDDNSFGCGAFGGTTQGLFFGGLLGGTPSTSGGRHHTNNQENPYYMPLQGGGGGCYRGNNNSSAIPYGPMMMAPRGGTRRPPPAPIQQPLCPPPHNSNNSNLPHHNNNNPQQQQAPPGLFYNNKKINNNNSSPYLMGPQYGGFRH